MHELAVCQSLMGQVECIAREREARSVASITLRIGPLSGVEAELLRQAFSIASAGSVAEGAELVIREQPLQVRCSRCGAVTLAEANNLVCATCGDWRTTLESGDEMLLESLELVTA